MSFDTEELDVVHTATHHATTGYIPAAASSSNASVPAAPRVESLRIDERVGRSQGSVNMRRVFRIVRTGLPILAVDILAIVTALLLAAAVTELLLAEVHYTRLHKQSLTLLAIICLVYPQFGLYPGSGLNPVLELRQLVVSTTLAYLLLLIANAGFGRLSRYEVIFLVSAWALSLLLLSVGRRLARSVVSRFRWWGQSALVIGGGRQGSRIYRALKAEPSLGLWPAGVVDELHRHWSEGDDDPPPYLGPPCDLATISEKHDAQWAIVATAAFSDSELPLIFDQCAWCIPNLVVVPNIAGVPSLWSWVQECAGQPGIYVQARLLLPLPRILKRLMDLGLVIGGGVLLLPLIMLIGLWIKICSPGPVFYSHVRIGLNGRRFPAWKFRTMVHNADAVLDAWLEKNPAARREWESDHKLRNDPRIIRGIGDFLRQFSLDELPQLWNVLRGEMSLVGPRPIVAAEIQKYAGSFHLYLKVPPGLTGLWQISGRNNTTYDERVRLDAYYVRNWSPWLDLYILVRTIKTVLLQEGAY